MRYIETYKYIHIYIIYTYIYVYIDIVINNITLLEQLEPEEKCIKQKIQTTIHVKKCKRCARIKLETRTTSFFCFCIPETPCSAPAHCVGHRQAEVPGWSCAKHDFPGNKGNLRNPMKFKKIKGNSKGLWWEAYGNQ